jgi:hypothetical protein
MHRLGRLGFAFLVCCLGTTRADASPIGIFTWTGDDLFGPLFTVENFSADISESLGSPSASFSSIFVDLVFADGTPASSLLLASIGDPGDTTIDPGEVAQNFALPLSFAIESASLRLAFPLDGTIALLDANGAPLTSLTAINSGATIDFTPPAPIPEPATMLLVGSGLVLARVLRHLKA